MSRPSSLLRPPPTASRRHRHFPGSPVIGGPAPVPRRGGAEEALSSSHDSLLAVPRPRRRGVPRHPLQAPWWLPWPSPFHHGLGSPLVLLAEASVTTLVGRMMLRTGQSLAPSQGLRRSASTAGSRPTPGAVLPGTLASPRTGLTPAGCRELLARLRHDRSFAFMASELLDARESRLTGC